MTTILRKQTILFSQYRLSNIEETDTLKSQLPLHFLFDTLWVFDVLVSATGFDTSKLALPCAENQYILYGRLGCWMKDSTASVCIASSACCKLRSLRNAFEQWGVQLMVNIRCGRVFLCALVLVELLRGAGIWQLKPMAMTGSGNLCVNSDGTTLFSQE